MSTQKNVGWVGPEVVTHQDQSTGQNEWQVLPIEQIADVNPRIDKSAIPDDLPVSFVPMPAVGAGDGSIHVDETRPAGEVKKGFTPFLEGDVLFAKITPCMENGKMAVVPKLVNGYGFGSTEFHVLRPKAGIDAKYLYYYVSSQSFRGEAERYMTGAVGQKRVSTTYLKEAKIPVAPLDQQKRIVAEIEKQFSRLDEAVANLKRVKANLKRYKAAVLKAAVEGRLVETEAEIARREGRSYETGAQLLQRILETRHSQWKGKGKYKEPAAPDTTDLPELPDGWVWSNFETAAERVTVGHVGPMKDEYVEQGIPFLRSQNVRANRYDSEGLKFISEKFHHQLAKSALQPGDIVVVRSGSVGVSCVIPEQLPEANCSDLVIVKAPRAVLPDFGAYYMNSVVETRVAAGKVGVALIHFNTQSVAELPLPIPPFAEQHQIVSEVDRRLSLLRETEAQVDANLQRAERLRQSLLQQAFSGHLVVGASQRVIESMTSPDAMRG
jgi:type I restriction enzyme S subunit